MEQDRTLSFQLAEFLTGLSYDSLGDNAVQMACLSFLDWLASGIAGGREKPGKIVSDLIREAGGNPQATLLTTGEKTSAPGAALVNGVCSHILELDDVHKASILHAGAAVMPAALAAAELAGAGGRKLIEGIVAGYEVGIRVGEAVTPSHYKYWHTTGTCGTFGAAAAAGKILGLNKEQMVYALGNAGSQAAGLWEFIVDGAMTKHLHPGKAAMNGLLAALLAARNFTGASRILEGDRGFFVSTAAEYDASKVTRGLGDEYKIEENCFKIHSSCRHTHSMLDAIIALAGDHNLNPTEIQSVKVNVYRVAVDIAGNPNPNTEYAAKFSLPFCAALGIARRSAGLQDFGPEALHDPAIRDIMQKTSVAVDPELDAMYPECWPARVAVETARGTFKGQADYPKGDPENPVSKGELEEKFFALVEPVLGRERASRLIKAVDNLPALKSPAEITKLVSSNQ